MMDHYKTDANHHKTRFFLDYLLREPFILRVFSAEKQTNRPSVQG